MKTGARRASEQDAQQSEGGGPQGPLYPRRAFLVRMGVTMAVTGAAACGGGGGEDGSPSGGAIEVGDVGDVPIGHFAFVPGRSLILARDEEGLYALGTICTHLGCDMASRGQGTITPDGLSCSCHGSRFSLSGDVLNGPATRPLPHYKVDLSPAGAITVQAGSIVASHARTPVPIP